MLPLARAVSTLFEIYEFIILAWCILRWIPRIPGGFVDDLSQVLSRLVMPYLGVFRRVIPSFGGIDFSPVVAILALSILQPIVVRLILML